MLSLSPMLSHLCTVLYMWALRNCLDTVGYICFLAGSKKGAKEKQKQNVNYRTIIRELKFPKLNSAQTEFLFDSMQSSHAQPSSEWKYSTEDALTFMIEKSIKISLFSSLCCFSDFVHFVALWLPHHLLLDSLWQQKKYNKLFPIWRLQIRAKHKYYWMSNTWLASRRTDLRQICHSANTFWPI